MKHYEIMTIYSSDLSEEEALQLSEKVKEHLLSLKGEVVNQNFWGKRKFAYPIDHKEDGYYDVIKFDMSEDSIAEIRNELNLMENLVRYLITVL
jgi:small subunit ribosomal protein S6